MSRLINDKDIDFVLARVSISLDDETDERTIVRQILEAWETQGKQAKESKFTLTNIPKIEIPSNAATIKQKKFIRENMPDIKVPFSKAECAKLISEYIENNGPDYDELDLMGISQEDLY